MLTRAEPYRDRVAAGRRLASALKELEGLDDALILGLPRGGVEVGAEVARALDLPLDVLIVRKIGVPWQPELALGAMASGGILLLNRDIAHVTGMSQEEIDEISETERRELERRERAYRDGAEPAEMLGRTVVVVDDGVATGATMRAAIASLRERGPARIVVGVPVGSPETLVLLQREADEVVCPLAPPHFTSIGEWYEEFPQLSDDAVRRLLEECRQRTPDSDLVRSASRSGL